MGRGAAGSVQDQYNYSLPDLASHYIHCCLRKLGPLEMNRDMNA